MKKLISALFPALLAALVISCLLSGCGSNGSDVSGTEPATEAATEAVTEAATEAATKDQMARLKDVFFDITYEVPDHKSFEDREVTDEDKPYSVRGYTCDGYMLILTRIPDSKSEELIENSEAYLEEDFGGMTFMTYYDGENGNAIAQNGNDVYIVRCMINGGETSEKMEQAFSDLLHSITPIR